MKIEDYIIDDEDSKLIVREKSNGYEIDLRKRLMDFAVKSFKFLMTLPNKKEYDVFRYQYSKCSTSIGANYEESQTTTFKEFVSRIRIVIRETNESLYFLRVMNELKIGDDSLRLELLDECTQLSKIFGKILQKIRSKTKN